MRWIIGLVVLALAVMLAGFDEKVVALVSAQDTGQAQAAGQSQSEAVPEDITETRFVYSGGALEGIRKVAENSPSTTTSTLFVNLVGATTSWFVPGVDSDLLNVSFSGECRLINSSISSTNQDWVEIRAVLSRVPAAIGFPTVMQPNDTVSPMAFCSANGYAMQHANWAARVSGGGTGATYIVQIQRRVRNNAPLANPLGVLTAWLDDWKLELAAHN
jgi:hypothetical protein